MPRFHPFLLVLGLLVGLAGPAHALGDGDRSAIRSVIEQQLQAFLADNRATAYSFASPGIQRLYPTAESFMTMVARDFPQVYRPRSYAFAELKEEAGSIEQYVDIVDGDGVFWTARYSLEKQPDGSWKISACVLVKKPGEVA